MLAMSLSYATRFLILWLSTLTVAGASSPALEERQAPVTSGNVSTFIQNEKPIALQGILNNVGSQGALVEGADSGIVVAAPSMENPNYFYSWTRDSALTMKYLADAYIAGNASLGSLLQDYIMAQAAVQQISNPSGDLSNGAGLGEPKFYVNETAFEGPWGRPQRDGPALRATAMMAYAKTLVSANQSSVVKDVIWPLVSNDLNYVAEYWNETGFDLWEEMDGSSFWTTAVQHRALVEGAAFASSIDETCSECTLQAPNLLCFLQDYWNGNSVVSNINLQSPNGRSGIDCNSILTSIHTYDPASPCDDSTFQPCSSYALSNHKVYVDSFRDIYPINSGTNSSSAVAVGRYPEDVYYGGNPWYLCTAAAAEQLYSALNQWDALSSLSVDSVSQAFFSQLVSGINTGTYSKDSSEYSTITDAVRTYADEFIAIFQYHTQNNGSLSEQYSKYDGYALSAYDLTWSYASFLTMAMARDGVLPASWNASSASDVSSCSSNAPISSVTGTFSTPTATTFPSSAVSNGDFASTGTQSSSGAGSTKSSSANKLEPAKWLREL